MKTVYEIQEVAEKALCENKIYGEVECREDDNKIVLDITIENGDWKHEHLRMDSVIISALNPNKVSALQLEKAIVIVIQLFILMFSIISHGEKKK